MSPRWSHRPSRQLWWRSSFRSTGAAPEVTLRSRSPSSSAGWSCAGPGARPRRKSPIDDRGRPMRRTSGPDAAESPLHPRLRHRDRLHAGDLRGGLFLITRRPLAPGRPSTWRSTGRSRCADRVEGTVAWVRRADERRPGRDGNPPRFPGPGDPGGHRRSGGTGALRSSLSRRQATGTRLASAARKG